MLSDLKQYALLAAYAGVLVAYAGVAAGFVTRAVNQKSIALGLTDAAYLIAASALLIWAVR